MANKKQNLVHQSGRTRKDKGGLSIVTATGDRRHGTIAPAIEHYPVVPTQVGLAAPIAGSLNDRDQQNGR